MNKVAITDPSVTVIYGVTEDDNPLDAAMRMIDEAKVRPAHDRPGYFHNQDPGEHINVHTHHADSLPEQWMEMAPLGVQKAGDVGGDAQVSEAFSRRWVMRRRVGDWAVFTATFYVALVPPSAGADQPRVVEVMEDYEIAEDLHDLDGSQTFAETRYRGLVGEPTEEHARLLAEQMNAGRVQWTGSEFYGHFIPLR